MDTIQHGAWGLLEARLLTTIIGSEPNLPLEAIFILLGIYQDVYPWLEGSYRQRGDWSVYTTLHYWHWWMVLIPPTATHTLMDIPFHPPGPRWWIWNEGLWAEILGWLAVGTGLVLLMG